MATSYRNMLLPVFLCFMVLCPTVHVAKKNSKTDLIATPGDLKEFKKLMRTHNNILVIFCKTAKDAQKQMSMFGEVADQMRGQATLALVDCGENKKMCKKMKASPSGVELKHYKDGEFNKDYDRLDTVKSMVSFLRDPTGDIPWDEDATAGDVVHIDNPQGLNKLLSKEKRPTLVMFYTPWCGFCKKLKPEYALAASELKKEAVLAGIDVDKLDNYPLRTGYNITGFPTLLYFEKGQMLYKYGGENNKDGLVNWMRDPQPPKEPEKEAEWADEESDVVHLTDETFDEYIEKNPSVLVMFYAPWCGHCKKMKPEYTEAAATLKEDEVEGTLAAVDATQAKKVGERFGIKGFPTVKYFKDGEFAWDYNERTADKLVDFMTDPQEPPPPPPPEPAWEEMESDVLHLTDENFASTLKKKKHALVMFYAPWCGHCKKAKPEYMAAAEKYKDDTKVTYAAMDCTQHQTICGTHDVSGYPTFKYFNYGKNPQKYTGGREEPDFVAFMKDPQNPEAAKPPKPSPETHWVDTEGHENIHHLSDSNFATFIKEHNSVLIMFYAPWCGHCKAMKPAYAEAATLLKDRNIDGVLAAVDATAEPSLREQYDIRGFPTMKYFKNGEIAFEYERGRTTFDLVDFMTNPVQATPPPPEPKWSDTPSNVNHLEEDFDTWVADKPHVLAMFYAPWCPHCKKAKPEMMEAANKFIDSREYFIAAVDCTVAKDVCAKYEVKGYPTFHYFNKGSHIQKYEGDRTRDDFVKFLQNPPKPEGEAGKEEDKKPEQKKEEVKEKDASDNKPKQEL